MPLLSAWNTLGSVFVAGNSLRGWLIAIAVLLMSFSLLQLLLRIVARNIPALAHGSPFGAALKSALDRGASLISSLFALWVSLQFLVFSPFAQSVRADTMLILTSVLFTLLLQFVSIRLLERVVANRGGSMLQFGGVLATFIRVFLWSVAFLLILSNLGINITSLIAGLGIGGIAVALAAQSVLGDVISAFSIFFDKPFRVGDFIIVGQHLGTVKSIGIKTTRIQALQGEEIVIPNRELTTIRIQNFKRMQRRRVEWPFRVDMHTPVGKVREIPAIVAAVYKEQKQATLERVNLKDMSAAGFVFEVAYYVEDADHNHFMAIHQEVLLRLLEEFTKQEIQIA